MAEFEDPYLYPGTRVLKNLANIRDAVTAEQVERRMSVLRRRELAVDPVRGNFDLSHLREIHRRLYQDVWAWAGQTRTVEITKGATRFHSRSMIDTGFESVHEWLTSQTQLLKDPDIGDDAFVEQAADLLEQVNFIHPFREGNGRTQRAYLDQIAGLSGRRFAWQNISAIDNERASIQAFNNASGAPFRALLSDALRPPVEGLSLLDPEPYRAAPAETRPSVDLAERYRRFPELGASREDEATEDTQNDLEH